MTMDEQFADIHRKLDAIFTKLDSLETHLLIEFKRWASPQEMRLRTHAAAIRALDAETEAQEDRLRTLESRR